MVTKAVPGIGLVNVYFILVDGFLYYNENEEGQ